MGLKNTEFGEMELERTREDQRSLWLRHLLYLSFLAQLKNIYALY